ncbi:MAG: GNAT family N-acetyltransferase [Acidobacteriota bacterium]|nr:GNAT family N-acetyltransferase [Acidobacteriota bacterium]
MTTSEFEVREYRPEDQEGVLNLLRELEDEISERFEGVEIRSVEDDYIHRYLKPEHKYRTFVALSGGTVVGYLMGFPSLGAPEIDDMSDVLPPLQTWKPKEFYLKITYVSRPFRRRGISTALHRAVIQYARKQGFQEVYACIAKWNEPELAVLKVLDFEMKDLGWRFRTCLKLT